MFAEENGSGLFMEKKPDPFSPCKCVDPEEATVIFRDYNGGKTTAVRNGLDVASGEWIIVQDADLEYDPIQIPHLLSIAQHCVLPARPAVAVFGRRSSYWQVPSRWLMSAGVLFIDLMILLIYGRWIRDHATCYELVPRSVLRRFNLESSGFEGCVEITAKLLNSSIPVIQVPIDYVPRTAKEGKKLAVTYCFAALRTVWRFRNWTPKPDDVNDAETVVSDREVSPSERSSEASQINQSRGNKVRGSSSKT